jgi:hypothetical protein
MGENSVRNRKKIHIAAEQLHPKFILTKKREK